MLALNSTDSGQGVFFQTGGTHREHSGQQPDPELQ
jgi:hypothetical protein